MSSLLISIVAIGLIALCMTIMNWYAGNNMLRGVAQIEAVTVLHQGEQLKRALSNYKKDNGGDYPSDGYVNTSHPLYTGGYLKQIPVYQSQTYSVPAGNWYILSGTPILITTPTYFSNGCQYLNSKTSIGNIIPTTVSGYPDCTAGASCSPLTTPATAMPTGKATGLTVPFVCWNASGTGEYVQYGN